MSIRVKCIIVIIFWFVSSPLLLPSLQFRSLSPSSLCPITGVETGVWESGHQLPLIKFVLRKTLY